MAEHKMDARHAGLALDRGVQGVLGRGVDRIDGVLKVTGTARYGYDISEPTAPTDNGGGGSNAWDSAVWDAATWQPDVVPSQPIRGVSGMGREVSVALQGNAIARTTLVGLDVYFTEGGPL